MVKICRHCGRRDPDNNSCGFDGMPTPCMSGQMRREVLLLVRKARAQLRRPGAFPTRRRLWRGARV
jgi:hypothetical protein